MNADKPMCPHCCKKRRRKIYYARMADLVERLCGCGVLTYCRDGGPDVGQVRLITVGM